MPLNSYARKQDNWTKKLHQKVSGKRRDNNWCHWDATWNCDFLLLLSVARNKGTFFAPFGTFRVLNVAAVGMNAYGINFLRNISKLIKTDSGKKFQISAKIYDKKSEKCRNSAKNDDKKIWKMPEFCQKSRQKVWKMSDFYQKTQIQKIPENFSNQPTF